MQYMSELILHAALALPGTLLTFSKYKEKGYVVSVFNILESNTFVSVDYTKILLILHKSSFF